MKIWNSKYLFSAQLKKLMASEIIPERKESNRYDHS